jgi:hypothetical protein
MVSQPAKPADPSRTLAPIASNSGFSTSGCCFESPTMTDCSPDQNSAKNHVDANRDCEDAHRRGSNRTGLASRKDDSRESVSDRVVLPVPSSPRDPLASSQDHKDHHEHDEIDEEPPPERP